MESPFMNDGCTSSNQAPSKNRSKRRERQFVASNNNTEDYTVLKQPVDIPDFVPNESSFDDLAEFPQNTEKVQNKMENENVYDCFLCQEIFDNIGALKSHLKSHAPRVPKYVNRAANRKVEINVPEEVISDPDEKPFQCSICPKAFNSGHDIEIHMWTHTGKMPNERQFIASDNDANGYLSTNQVSSENESNICSDNDTDNFTIVKQEVDDLDYLNDFTQFQQDSDDMQIKVENENEYDCFLCQELFDNIGALKLHLKTHAPQVPKYVNRDELFDTKTVNMNATEEVLANSGGKPFQCSICYKAFNSGRDTQIHMRTHTGERPYKCLQCGQTFVSTRGLRQHGKIHSGVKPYECSVCLKRFFVKTDMNTHMRTHTKERPFHCSICELTFSYKSNLYKHIRRNHAVAYQSPSVSGEGSQGAEVSDNCQRCAFCSKPFFETAEFEKHLKTHTGEKPYSCDLCEQKFGSNVNLVRHKKRIHHGTKSFKCDICEKTFREQYELTVHCRTHTGEKPYKCPVCDGAYATASSRKRHVTRVHIAEKAFECSVCYKKFIAKSDVDCHMRTHTGEKPYTCSYCNRGFTTNSMLHRHVRSIHTGDKPYQCSVCFKKYHSIYDVTFHMAVHTGEKPFSCARCDTKFRTRYSMKKHHCMTPEEMEMQKEQGISVDNEKNLDKPFKEILNKSKGEDTKPAAKDTENDADKKPNKCSQCGKVFGMKACLNMHMKSHGEGKLFNCLVCGESFKRGRSLGKHMKKHAGERSFKCTLCEKSFRFKRILGVHTRGHSGKKPYSCHRCGEAFSLMSCLQLHKMNFHKDGKERSMQYLCSVCGKRFCNRSNVYRHVRKTHSGIEPKEACLVLKFSENMDND